MRDIRALFADYASHHQTKGNKWFHRFGIPMIMLTLIGMLARVPIVPHVDAAIVLIVIAEIVYAILDWRLAALMLLISAVFYLIGAALPFWINVAFFRLNALVSTIFLIVTVAEVVFQGGFRLR